MNPFEQLISALAGVPVLRGARCRGRHALFDPQEGNEPDDIAAARRRQAIGLCVGITPDDPGCPALQKCSEWLESRPPTQPVVGVVAGRYFPAIKPRKVS